MNTLKQIAALHIDKLSGGMQGGDSQLFYRSTIIKIRALMNEIIQLKQLEARSEGDKNGPAQYIASYDLAVTKADGVAKVVLPEFYLQMPFNGGIYRVFQKDRRQGGFDFVRTFNPGVSSNTEAGNYAGYKQYWSEGKTIFFRRAFTEPTESMDVTVQIFVAAPDTIGENDPLPVSPDQVAEILRRLDQLAQPMLPQDKLNNNNPNI